MSNWRDCGNDNNSIVLISANRLALIAGLAATLLASLAQPQPAHACSCVPPGSPEEELAQADAVFAGAVFREKVHRKGLFSWSGSDPVTVEFRVNQVWKGPRQETQTVRTVLSEASCGYRFKEGVEYIVYVRNGETGLCTRNGPTWRAFDDIVAFGQGWRPDPTLETEQARSGCGASDHGTGRQPDVAALGLLAGALVLGIRRRPRL